MHRTTLFFSLATFLLVFFFLVDIAWGTIDTTWMQVVHALIGGSDSDTTNYLILNYRLPKAITALMAGAGISVAGLMMQCLFRNPLADTSILGIGSGAGLGVSFYTMAFVFFPSLTFGGMFDTWGVVLAAFIGATAVLLLISAIASWVRDVISVLIIGVMIGFLASSLISIFQFFSDEQALKGYLLWSFGSLSGITWRQLGAMLPPVGLGLALSMLMPKYMNAMSIGESYTRSVGINPRRVRIVLVLTTSLISGCITAFTGPIAFLGVAVPHFARLLIGSSDHRVLIPATILSGSVLMLICDILTQMPGHYFLLPINAITSLIGAPVVIFILLRGRQRYQVFS